MQQLMIETPLCSKPAIYRPASVQELPIRNLLLSKTCNQVTLVGFAGLACKKVASMLAVECLGLARLLFSDPCHYSDSNFFCVATQESFVFANI